MADIPDWLKDKVLADEPEWLKKMVDDRVALMMEATGGVFPDKALVATPLTEPGPGEEFDNWDHRCDRCGVIPDDRMLFVGHCFRQAPDGSPIIINFGVCPSCKDKP